jgi:hypothetical protein
MSRENQTRFRNPIRLFSPLVFFLAVFPMLGACGRLNGGFTPVGSPVVKNDVRPFDLSAKDLEFSRHLILELAQSRRMIDYALNMKPKERVWMAPGEIDDVGCRVMKKISPVYSGRKTETFIESFEMRYTPSCRELGNEKTASSWAEMTGTETYTIGYAKPFPKEGDAIQMPDIPESIVVSAHDIRQSLKLRSAATDKVNVAPDIYFSALISDRDEKTVTYTISMKSTSSFLYDVQNEIRRGEVTTVLSDVQIKVDLASRLTTAIVNAKMDLILDGVRADKSDSDLSRTALTNRQVMQAGMTLQSTKEMTFPTSLCDIADGAFKMNKSGDLGEHDIVVDSGNLKIDNGKKTEKARVCQDPIEDPVYLDDLEGVYN